MDKLDDVTATAPDGAAPAAAPVRTILKSVCRSCHGGCGVNLHVEDGRLVKVEGDRTSPLNRGRLCPIGTSTLDLVYHPDRLKYPMRRTGARGEGKWERISWDEAFGYLAEKLTDIAKRHGPQANSWISMTGNYGVMAQMLSSRVANCLGGTAFTNLGIMDNALGRIAGPCRGKKILIGGREPLFQGHNRLGRQKQFSHGQLVFI
mgnify:CR=1 FL=1